jgi:hypothetical protein
MDFVRADTRRHIEHMRRKMLQAAERAARKHANKIEVVNGMVMVNGKSVGRAIPDPANQSFPRKMGGMGGRNQT